MSAAKNIPINPRKCGDLSKSFLSLSLPIRYFVKSFYRIVGGKGISQHLSVVSPGFCAERTVSSSGRLTARDGLDVLGTEREQN
jgi:hypothetical protein